MGVAPMAYVLWTEVMRHNPADPSWFNRDRFVLSAGHGSMLLYALLHLTGYDSQLRRSKLPAMGQQDSWASRIRINSRGRNNHGSAWAGIREWSRDGHGGSASGSEI